MNLFPQPTANQTGNLSLHIPTVALSNVPSPSHTPRRQRQNLPNIILPIRRLVPLQRAADATAMGQNISDLLVRLGGDGVHDAAAARGTVTRIDVHVQRAEAIGAVVAGGVAQRLHGLAAVRADKAAVVFGEAFLLHRMINPPFGSRNTADER